MLPLLRVQVVERGTKADSGWTKCEIGKTLEFNSTALSSYFYADWEPMVFDALLLAAAVEYCDKVKRRPGLAWGREFHLHVPVHNPRHWSSESISAALHDALTFLTGDKWKITFYKRAASVDRPQQGLFNLPMAIKAVIPFSDGLDSRAVSALMEREYGDALVHVRLGTKSDDKPRNANGRPLPFASVPYKVKGKKGDFRESSARSRGFKFALLSGLAAYLGKAEQVIVPESGQGALGPTLVPVGQAYQDFRNHPAFTARMSRFLKALLNYDVRYEFPRLWNTKGETLREYVNAHPKSDEWRTTRSCWQDNRQSSVGGKRRQCGICAACMLRRMSIHAAGLKEEKETYIWESLAGPDFKKSAVKGYHHVTPRKQEYAIAGTLHLDHMARFRKDPLTQSAMNLSIFQLSKALNKPENEIKKNVERMLTQHETEWSNFKNSLGNLSFVAKWVGRKS
ncbi:MAG: 7-cyano-7-deazaguanine synthase [Xanthobacteraceae bacterium]|nr:7-cyano-7-deazaguanine synthase [Xanthobacteraceae bacterium]